MRNGNFAKRRLVSALSIALAAATLLCAGCGHIDEGGADTTEAVESTAAVTTEAATESASETETEAASESENATESATGTESETEAATESAAETETEESEPVGMDAPTDRRAMLALGDVAAIDGLFENAIDGVVLDRITGKTFKGYVMLVRDPSRVSVAIKDKSFSAADRIYNIVEQYGALAAINGGEFPDDGYHTEPTPIGLTYSGGECVWDDGTPRTFMGFTADDTLVVGDGMTKDRAEALGVRDAVSFGSYNTLVSNDGANVHYHYTGYTDGVSQRTAIGQLADGTVIFVVTDGRSAASLGATRDEIIDILARYGAVTAGMLDGGASSLMWYRDWSSKYGADQSLLDDWQRGGLVNIFKPFTYPRAMPTFFIVSPSGASGSAVKQTTEIVVPTGYSVSVDGAPLGEANIVERSIPSVVATQLPSGASDATYVKYALAGSPDAHSVAVTAPGGAAAEVTFNQSDRAYHAYPISDAALEGELAAYAVEAMSEYALMMSADRAWDSVKSYFDPASAIYNYVMLSAQFTWTVISHDSAVINGASATNFVRLSDSAFSCRVRLTNTLTSGWATANDRVDSTVVFRKVGGEWLICGMAVNG